MDGVVAPSPSSSVDVGDLHPGGDVRRSYQQFVVGSSVLYDHLVNFGLEWPSLSVQWMHEERQEDAHSRTSHQDERKSDRAADEAAVARTKPREVDSQLFIGTHTSGAYPNFIQLARVRLPLSHAHDPLQQLLEVPLLSHLRDGQRANASSLLASSGAARNRRERRAAAAASAGAAPSSSSLPVARPAPLNGDYTPHLSSYQASQIEVHTRLKAQHELHRIRPILMPKPIGVGGNVMHAVSDHGEDAMADGSISSSGAPAVAAFRNAYTRSLFATKGPEPDVKLYDIARARTTPSAHAAEENSHVGGGSTRKRPHAAVASSSGSSSSAAAKSATAMTTSAPLLTLTGHSTGGWPLDWNGNPNAPPALLASADDAGGICVWNLDDFELGGAQLPTTMTAAQRAARTRLHARHHWTGAHEGTINDISWQRTGSWQQLFTVGDDGMLNQWDLRHPTTSTVAAVRCHEGIANSVSSAPHKEYHVLTSSVDQTIRLWDTRFLSDARGPVHTFRGHTDQVLQVCWAPFDHHAGGVFASSSADRRVMIWDCSLVDAPLTQADFETSGPPELLFVHFGHTTRVEDFSWHPAHDWLMASVGEENVVQVWQCNPAVYTDVDPSEKPIFDAVCDIMTRQEHQPPGTHRPTTDGETPTASVLRPHVGFDLERILKLLPASLHSRLFTASTTDPLAQSSLVAPVAAYLASYGASIDGQLTAAGDGIATVAESDEISESSAPIEWATASAPSIAERTEGGSGRPRSPARKRGRLLVQIVEKESKLAKSDATTAKSAMTRRAAGALGAPPALLQAAQRLKKADEKLRATQEHSTAWKLATTEREEAIRDVIACVPNREEAAAAGVAVALSSPSLDSSDSDSSATSGDDSDSTDDDSPLIVVKSKGASRSASGAPPPKAKASPPPLITSSGRLVKKVTEAGASLAAVASMPGRPSSESINPKKTAALLAAKKATTNPDSPAKSTQAISHAAVVNTAAESTAQPVEMDTSDSAGNQPQH